jgi:transposase
MNRFIEGEDRRQATLLPDSLEDYVTDDNPVRVIDVFIDELDLAAMGFAGVEPEATGRPAYHPVTLLKIYLYGYLNRIQSSRRLERETQRNIELMWLTGRLMPDLPAELAGRTRAPSFPLAEPWLPSANQKITFPHGLDPNASFSGRANRPLLG